MNSNAAFQWECQPLAEKFILDVLGHASKQIHAVAELQSDLLIHTSTRLFDWLDHVIVPSTPDIDKKLTSIGFVLQKLDSEVIVYHHPGAQLPRILVSQKGEHGIAVSVDQIADFIMARGICAKAKTEGSLFGNYRRCLVSYEKGVHLWIVERRGTQTMTPTEEDSATISKYLQALEFWMTRPRALENEAIAMEKTIKWAKELVNLVGQHRAAWTVLEGERRYWQLRNMAGQLQKGRQDRLGMGWANHDHHTFRSSREFLFNLVHLFEILGFSCRERYYAGKEAGWGAQIMENPVCRLVLFLDVDLDPEEIVGDISHHPLPVLDHLGTIGLWCALHGDSILKAGMHHLEAQFMFDELTHDLSKAGVKMMFPFSSFPFLKQAFTVGEMWPVDPIRIQRVLNEGKITPEHAEKFRKEGALGSHLENLQRREGYKGFNQKNVSIIIKKTDPRLEQR